MKLKMKLILLLGLFPKETKNEIFKNSKGVIQYAADNLQWSLVDGLTRNNVEFMIINLPYIGSYPVRFKKIYSEGYSFSAENGVPAKNVGFVNLLGYKALSRFINIKKELNNAISGEKEKVGILIYAMHTPFLKAAVELKKVNANLKIILMVPDLPQHMGETSSLVTKFLKKQDNKELYKLVDKVDAFVLLSEYMKDELQVKKRPYTVVEGIFNNSLQFESVQKEGNFTVLYTGTLAKRYGILNLLDAFHQIPNEDYSLWICGDGDGKAEVLDMVANDNRIKYLGQLPNTEILKLQRKASVLVNPRTSDSEFTKFSFPSKTLEYLASGTPTIIHPLDGIPQEYYDYTITAHEQSANGLREKITEVAYFSNEKRKKIGERAQKFIFENKNPKVQTLKIIEILNKL